MAHGNGRPNEIAQAAGLAGRGNPAAYLTSLRELHLVERRVPVTVRNPERSRRGLYRLADPFLRFWFRFVLPNRTALEAGDANLVWLRKVEPHLAQHVGWAFEEAAREHLQDLNRRGRLPALYDRVGGWWRGSNEVDVVAVADDGPLLLGECKWTARPIGRDVLRNLEAKVSLVQADLKRRRRGLTWRYSAARVSPPGCGAMQTAVTTYCYSPPQICSARSDRYSARAASRADVIIVANSPVG